MSNKRLSILFLIFATFGLASCQEPSTSLSQPTQSSSVLSSTSSSIGVTSSSSSSSASSSSKSSASKPSSSSSAVKPSSSSNSSVKPSSSSASSSQAKSSSLTSSSQVPQRKTEQELIKDLTDSMNNMHRLTQGTYTHSMISQQGPDQYASESKITFTGAEYYEKTQASNQVIYDIIAKVGEQYIYSEFTTSSRYNTKYVNEKHAKDLAAQNGFGGFNTVGDALNLYGNFKDFSLFTLGLAFEGADVTFTENDVIYNINITDNLENHTTLIDITLDMKSEWCKNNTMSGMEISEIGIGFSFTYNNDLIITSYSATTHMTVMMMMNMSMSMISTDSLSYSREVDQTLKQEVTNANNKLIYPDDIYYSSTRIEFFINGSEFDNENPEWQDKENSKECINKVLFDYENSLNNLINAGKFADEVNIEYLLNGEVYNVNTYPNLSSMSNRFDIIITPKESNKTLIIYEYREVTIYIGGGMGYFPVYALELAVQSSTYQIKTSYQGVNYNDKIALGDYEAPIQGTTYDITGLSSVKFVCMKIKQETPRNNLVEHYILKAIDEFETLKDIEVEKGVTVGDYLSCLIGASLIFDLNNDVIILYVDQFMDTGTLTFNGVFEYSENIVFYSMQEMTYNNLQPIPLSEQAQAMRQMHLYDDGRILEGQFGLVIGENLYVLTCTFVAA